jgi:hypothetical protein
LPINDFGQQHLNDAADQSIAKGGQILPHFEHIVSGALTLPSPIAAVFQLLCSLSVISHWWLVVGHWLLVSPQ